MVISYNSYKRKWECNPCIRSFVHRAALEQHLESSGYHWWCAYCERDFATQQARRQHWINHSAHHYCTDCDINFEDDDQLHEHEVDDHFLCTDCNLFHNSQEELEEHIEQMHHYCDYCVRSFPTAYALQQHTMHKHSFCVSCNRYFNSDTARRQHWINSSAHHFCVDCNQELHSDGDLIQHRINAHNWCNSCDEAFATHDELLGHDADQHFRCIHCSKFFDNANNLRMHLNSSKHKPRSLICPMRTCNAAFTSISALIAHAESGGCRSGVTRREIDRMVAKADLNGVITGRLRITGLQADHQYPFDNNVSYFATGRAWNGSAYECYLCHKTFRQLKDLNAHLSSPVHVGAKMYHCPPRGYGTKFNTLSGLMRHIEDESCGVRRFRFVEKAIKDSVERFSDLRTMTFEIPAAPHIVTDTRHSHSPQTVITANPVLPNIHIPKNTFWRPHPSAEAGGASVTT
jgi:hypothetical protein